MYATNSMLRRANRMFNEMRKLCDAKELIYKAKLISPTATDEEILAEMKVCKARVDEGYEVYYVGFYGLESTPDATLAEVNAYKARLKSLGWLDVAWAWDDPMSN